MSAVNLAPPPPEIRGVRGVRGWLRRVLAPRRDRVRGIRPIPAAALLALPLLFALLAAAGPAEANTRFLVGNTSVGDQDSYSGAGKRSAQEFRTGNNGKGYSLSNVQIAFRGAPSAADLSKLTVTIRRGTTYPDVPAEGSLGTLTNPSSGTNGLNTFTAPGAGISLNPNTTYFVVIGMQGGLYAQCGLEVKHQQWRPG